MTDAGVWELAAPTGRSAEEELCATWNSSSYSESSHSSSSDHVAAAGCPLAFAMIWGAVMVVWLLAAHGLAAIWKAVVGTLP